MQQPVEAGSIGVTGGRNVGMEIKGVTNIRGTLKDSARNIYTKGIAQFGDLYFYFNDEYFKQNIMSVNSNADLREQLYQKVSRFGGSSLNNTFPLFALEGMTTIYQIKNDANIKLYLLIWDTGGGGNFFVIGTNKNGKWVKYFDTGTAERDFKLGRSVYYCYKHLVAGDTIIFQYGHNRNAMDFEIRYKWDESAQWFSVDKVNY